MDSHQDPRAMSHSVHNLDGMHNGIYANQYDSYYPDHSNSGFDQSWAFDQSGNNISSAQSVPSYAPDWASSHTSLHDPNAYLRSTSKSPAVAQPSPSYSQYPQLRQYADAGLYDPALTGQTIGTNTFIPNTSNVAQYPPRPSPGVTINPHALENAPSQSASLLSRQPPSQPPVDQKALVASIPSGGPNGQFLVIDHVKLGKSTNSRQLNAFVNIGQQDFEYPINRAVVPAAPVRKSVNDLRQLAVNDPKLLSKLGKKVTKKALASIRKQPGATSATLARSSVSKVDARNAAASPSSASSEETDTSDEDSDEDFAESSPLPAKRPEESPDGAVEYDTIKALWRPRKKVLSRHDLKTGLAEFWEIVRTIRDRWKTDTSAVKAADEKGAKGELPLLKSRVRDQRNMMETAMRAALKHGHRGILEWSSENVPFLVLCLQFLHDRYLMDDVNGPLARSILTIMAMCLSLTDDKLSKTKLDKWLPKLGKKGDSETNALLKRVDEAAKEGTRRAKEEEQDKRTSKAVKVEPSTTTKVESPGAKAASGKPNTEPVAGVKRPAPQSSTNGQPAKRLASTASTSDATNGQRKTQTTVRKVSADSTSAKASTTMTNTLASSTKNKATIPKPSSFFNVATNKKPAQTTKPAAASVLANALKSVEKKPAQAAASVTPPAEKPAGSSWSFASTLANITKPKEKPPSPKPEASLPRETPEQKAKRLRKEARRGLRVSFKPEGTLVEIQYFTHDPDEELGHDARDVSDVGSEGRMFKQHKDMMDVDDEEDAQGEEEIKPFTSPGLINFDDVEADERERNFAPFGGGAQEPESPEKASRDEYEANTLLVIYSDPREIPANPKEPADESEQATAVTAKSFGSPQETTLDRAKHMAAAAATQIPTPGTQQTASTTDITALLAALAPQASQGSSIPSTSVSSTSQPQQNFDLAAFLSGQHAPHTQAQPPPPVTSNVQANGGIDLAKLFAQIQPQHQPQQAPVQAPAQQQSAQLAALFATMQQNPAAMPPPVPGGFPPGFPPAGFPFMPPQPPNQQQPAMGPPYENEERRRLREVADWNQDTNGGQSSKKKGWTDKRFTQPCKYWSLGKCQKGDKCTYRHE